MEHTQIDNASPPVITRTGIPYGRQWIDEEDIEAVIEVLRSDRLTQGPKIEEFERTVAEYCGAEYAVAVSSGTAALHIAAIASGLQPGDEGVTSPNTFLASANCVAYCGALPMFADIQSDTFNIDPFDLERRITLRSKVVIPVHFAGRPCDMEAIREIAGRANLFVIEDAAHALGSKWRDRQGRWHKVGSCSHSHMTIFSFHPVKTITTGEGGMILTNNPALAERCRLLSNHGVTRDSSRFTDIQSPPPWYYEMQELGFNYRITDIQCALGLAQMKRLPFFIERRREIWHYYNERLSDIDSLRLPKESEGAYSCRHLYVVRAADRDSLLTYLRSKGIGAHAMYIPVHLQPYYKRKFGYKKGDFPNAESYFDECLILPLYPGMTDEMIDYVADTVKAFHE